MICPTCAALNADSATICSACGSALSAGQPTSGDTVSFPPSLATKTPLRNGAYSIASVLGQGGFGITYKGGEMQLRRYVAIKEFFPYGAHRQGNSVHPPPGTGSDSYAEARRRFMQEAMILARFNHPAIVRVFGAFEENNTVYMVMELLEGESLQKRLEAKGVLPEKEAVHIMTQIGEAMSMVHEAKLLHRDIKPDNIMLVSKGTTGERAVLIDFGTAREFAADKTRNMTAMVTHGYAPLEQYGKQAKFGPYTDIYALGATLYHCLTGTLPVLAMDRLVGVDLLSPQQVNPNISRAVSEAVMWALQIKAPERPQSVAEWLQVLQQGSAPIVQPVLSATMSPPFTPTRVASWLPPASTMSQGTAMPDSGAHNPNWQSAASSHYSQTCPHCGAKMALSMRICPVCHRSNEARVGMKDQDSFVPLAERPDTFFDKFMGALPWHFIGSALFVLILGRVALGIVRYQNGSRDFGTELAQQVMVTREAASLTGANLKLGEGIYDDQTLTRKHDDYVGTVRYKDGDVGVLNLEVKTRDWLYVPERFVFTFHPADFGSQIADSIQAEVNQKIRDDGGGVLVREMTLTRITRTQYIGTFTLGKDDKTRHPVVATVKTFNGDGSPATWIYALD